MHEIGAVSLFHCRRGGYRSGGLTAWGHIICGPYAVS